MTAFIKEKKKRKCSSNMPKFTKRAILFAWLEPSTGTKKKEKIHVKLLLKTCDVVNLTRLNDSICISKLLVDNHWTLLVCIFYGVYQIF